MAYDLDFYMNRKRSLLSQISQGKTNNTKLQKEYDALLAAYKDLKRIQTTRVSPLEKKIKKKNYIGTLRWRGTKKNDFDKILDEDVKKAASGYSKAVNKLLNTLNSAVRNKKRELDQNERSLKNLNNSYRSVLSTINNWSD